MQYKDYNYSIFALHHTLLLFKIWKFQKISLSLRKNISNMAKKKQSKPQQQQLSPVRFLKERVRQVPVYKCYISKSLVNETEGSIMVVRKHTDGEL